MSTIYAVSHSVGQCCVKMEYRNLEISIAFDNSCGVGGMTMFRTDMRIYENDIDITNKVYPDQKNGVWGVETKDVQNVFNDIDNFLYND